VIKLVYCFNKKPGLSDEQFLDYWRNVHGALGAQIPGLRKLVQSCRLAVPGDAAAPDYDGVAELWFDDMDSLLAARHSAEWKASTEDETNFIDPTCTAYLVTEEHIVLDAISDQPRS
jgi:uncharacterized protein (TIGR02118 family)